MNTKKAPEKGAFLFGNMRLHIIRRGARALL